MKTFIVLSISIVANTAGNIFLSKGMKALGDPPVKPEDPFRLALQALNDPMVLLGVGLLLIFYILFLASLSWADLSFVLPIVSFSYVVNAFFAKYLLGESIPIVRWAGIILVSIGVYLVSKTVDKAKTA